MPDYHHYLKNCSQQLEVQPAQVGMGLKPHSALFSVYCGKDAIRRQEYVRQIYSGCWYDADRLMRHSTMVEYNPEYAEQQVNLMRGNFGAYADTYAAIVAYYWDIMDENFETDFEKIKQKISWQQSLNVFSLYFIFSREATAKQRALKRERLLRLVEWAEQQKKHLVLFSDATDLGLLSDEMYDSNYRIAADLLLMCNSSGQAAGDDLRMRLQQGTLFACSYAVMEKDTKGIAAAVTYTVLDEFSGLEYVSSESSFRDRICGGKKATYQTLLDQYLDAVAQEVLPSDAEWLKYLPQSNQRQRIFCAAGHVAPKGGGLLGLFGWRSEASVETENITAAAMEDLLQEPISGDILQLTMAQYYVQPLLQLVDSEEGHKKALNYFSDYLSSRLSYQEMKDFLGGDRGEIAYLKAQSCEQWNMWKYTGSQKWEDVMHSYFRQKAYSQCYQLLMQRLVEAMELLNQHAGHFDEVIGSIKANLSNIYDLKLLRNSYDAVTRKLVREHSDEVMRSLRPSTDEGLLQQLEMLFGNVIKWGNQTFRNSYEEHLRFLINNGTSLDARQIIDVCFNQDMSRLRHFATLNTPTGRTYNMVSRTAAFVDAIGEQQYGKVFRTVRADCIERVYLFDVDPLQILYD